MSSLKDRLKGKSIQELYEAAEVFDRKNYTIKTNRSGDGISITKQGLLTIQKNLADKIGDENLQYLELRQQFSDSDSLLIVIVRSASVAEKLENFSELLKKGALKKRQNSKSQVKFSVKTILRAFVSNHGSSDLKSRWISMFDAGADDVDANGYVFTEEDGSLLQEQTDGDNKFVVDMMLGEGNKQG